MVTLRIRIVAVPAKRDEVTATLQSLAGPALAQPGCTATRVYNELSEDAAVTFEAEWRSWPDLERHLRTAAFRTLLATMELASEAPTFEVDELQRRRGFEFVEEVLGAKQAAAAAGHRT